MEITKTLLKINDPYRTQTDQSSGSARAQKNGQADAAQTASLCAQGDRVSVSPEARLATAALSTAHNAPEVRRQKIDEVKERINTGEYSINSRDIARKLLQQDALLADTLGNR